MIDTLNLIFIKRVYIFTQMYFFKYVPFLLHSLFVCGILVIMISEVLTVCCLIKWLRFFLFITPIFLNFIYFGYFFWIVKAKDWSYSVSLTPDIEMISLRMNVSGNRVWSNFSTSLHLVIILVSDFSQYFIVKKVSFSPPTNTRKVST